LKFIFSIISYYFVKLKNFDIIEENMTQFQKYIQAALNKAKYVFDEESKTYIAVVEELPICWAQGKNYEETREELASVIEGWVLLSIQKGDTIPSLEGVSLDILKPQKKLEYA
jgi:predicted RNase H-like HicB family nuclease